MSAPPDSNFGIAASEFVINTGWDLVRNDGIVRNGSDGDGVEAERFSNGRWKINTQVSINLYTFSPSEGGPRKLLQCGWIRSSDMIGYL